MKHYINNALQRFQNKELTKPAHSPHLLQLPAFIATTQHAPEPDKSLPLSPIETTKLQEIAVILLCYARAVDNKLLITLGSIEILTPVPTNKPFDLITHLLNYVATYPDDGIICRKIHMQLAAHSEVGYLNE